MYKRNVFDVKVTVECWGIWYALWLYGCKPSDLWTLFVACRMIKRENKVLRLV